MHAYKRTRAYMKLPRDESFYRLVLGALIYPYSVKPVIST